MRYRVQFYCGAYGSFPLLKLKVLLNEMVIKSLLWLMTTFIKIHPVAFSILNLQMNFI